MEGFIKSTRPWRWGFALALLAVGVLGGLLQWFNTCEQQALDTGQVVTTCRDPSVSDAAVVFGGVLFLVLIAPDFEEAGLFGFSLKRRVEEQEKRQQTLEGQLSLVTARIDAVVAGTATATANTNVYVLTEEGVRRAREAVDSKAPEFLREVKAFLGSRVAAEAGEEVPGVISVEELVPPRPAPPDADLRMLVISIWGELEQLAFPPEPQRRSLMDLPRMEARRRFQTIFAEELQVVHAARNAAVHAQPVDRHVLEEAVEVGNRLLSIARTSLA